ncbi:MAG: 16S rRNA (cytidine(1402)-2'-O)-methyltransferase [Clostridiales bacterium]|nr:16S rRNA (cytidine(1402)-2'-O)-methyltransferase [Clostridiales bacterium]
MLYLVSTPIGNLKDISLRAIETLKEVDYIACEDTRHSLVLLNHYDIKKPLLSYHKFNEEKASLPIIEKLKEGKNIALISDAGMPVISDPGNILIKKLKEENLEYTVIPGATASLSALLLSGLSADKFCFLGFLPEKKKDRLALKKYANLGLTLIFYSAPHDLKKDLTSLKEIFGCIMVVAVKEITKLNEKVNDYDLSKLDEYDFSNIKGEFVLLLETKEENSLNNLTKEEHFNYYLEKGYDKKEAIKLVAKDRNVSKSSLYKLTIEK